jgi:hypothetical protein
VCNKWLTDFDVTQNYHINQKDFSVPTVVISHNEQTLVQRFIFDITNFQYIRHSLYIKPKIFINYYFVIISAMYMAN